MRVRGVVEEDFTNYKEPSMFIISSFCDFKCCVESGMDIGVCQNAPLVQSSIKEIPNKTIYEHFSNNPITKAVVIGGLEPLEQTNEVLELIRVFRNNGNDCVFVIYTGYYPNEVSEKIQCLERFKNVIVKFGRYIPNSTPVYDEVLGVTLASSNQYAQRIS